MKHINGLLLKQMIISGANNLFNCYPEVDALNVFPVPDGDTGTNMNLTISSGAKEVANRTDESVYDIARSFSRGLLMGARGNSGVILSQIFRGFAQSLEGKDKIDTLDLADAFMMGKQVAYKAVMKPVEGTILTVIRESSEVLFNAASSEMSIEEAFDIFLEEARASLKRTPDLLPVLKEVGVVDSGGTGLLKILEGFEKALHGNVVEKNMATITNINQNMAGSEVEADGEFGYCTEFLIRLPENPAEVGKKVFVEKRFTNVLNSHGNSLVVVRDEDIVKVHVHTLKPGNVLSYAQQYGEFIKLKIENMSEQHTELVEQGKDPAKPTNNDNKEVEEEVEMKEFAIIAVAVGDGIEKLFKDYRASYIVSGGQTMNPSTEDFVAAIEKCHAKNIFILPNNSNIIMAASQACEVVEGVNARVIPTRTIPQGLTACMMFNEEATFEENAEEMFNAMSSVKTGQVTFAIKDTSIDGVEVKKDEFIGISNKAIVCCYKDKIDSALHTLSTMVDDMSSIITVLIGENVTEDEINTLQAKIEEKYSDVDVDIKIGNQPVYSFIIAVE